VFRIASAYQIWQFLHLCPFGMCVGLSHDIFQFCLQSIPHIFIIDEVKRNDSQSVRYSH